MEKKTQIRKTGGFKVRFVKILVLSLVDLGRHSCSARPNLILLSEVKVVDHVLPKSSSSSQF